MSGFRTRSPPAGRLWLGLVATCVAAFGFGGVAESNQAPTAIYSCIDSKGRRVTADRPIAECSGKEQQILNRDGSPRGVLPPTLTAEERLEKEARERAEAEQRAAQVDAVRRDRNLMTRYPSEASHNRAREASVGTVRQAMKASEIRLSELAQERKPLRDEAEFYQGKQLPGKLKAAVDANDAAVDAQRAAGTTQEAELDRINTLYDAELNRLRRLWSGASPGSLGPLPSPYTVTGRPVKPKPKAQ